jgi:hypothetical protein
MELLRSRVRRSVAAVAAGAAAGDDVAVRDRREVKDRNPAGRPDP